MNPLEHRPNYTILKRVASPALDRDNRKDNTDLAPIIFLLDNNWHLLSEEIRITISTIIERLIGPGQTCGEKNQNNGCSGETLLVVKKVDSTYTVRIKSSFLKAA
ncbi:MAG: hypothetical protein E3J72_10760 [Planctomycetota bacterium]|nr:MAG: hypothetical protein E3J72_10760 [Planctomycetota bacterium]